MGEPIPGGKSKFVTATVIGIDPETQQQHQVALYTAPLLVKFGNKHIMLICLLVMWQLNNQKLTDHMNLYHMILLSLNMVKNFQ